MPTFVSVLDRQTKWSICSLSGQPLHPPIVADFLGSLYNKEAVLEFLLGRAGHFADEGAEVWHCLWVAKDFYCFRFSCRIN